MKDWKSTATGILSLAITTLVPINALLAGNDLSVGAGIHWSTLSPQTKIAIGVSMALGLCRAWLGVITKNADAGAVAKAINAVADIGPGAVPATTASLTATPKES